MLPSVNELNRTMSYTQFHWNGEKKRLFRAYFLIFDGGLDSRQFIKTLRHFSAAFRAGAQELTNETGSDDKDSG